MRKKIYLAVSILMLLNAVGFVVYALSHPETSFTWSNTITYTIYLLYIAFMIGFFIASRRTTE